VQEVQTEAWYSTESSLAAFETNDNWKAFWTKRTNGLPVESSSSIALLVTLSHIESDDSQSPGQQRDVGDAKEIDLKMNSASIHGACLSICSVKMLPFSGKQIQDFFSQTCRKFCSSVAKVTSLIYHSLHCLKR
jgi:hypothetical protein